MLKATLFFFLIGVNVFGQQKDTSGEEANWVRFESPARDFSVALPSTGYLVDNEDGGYRLHYFSSQVAIRVEMISKSRAKDDFKLSYNLEQEKKYRLVETGDFLIGQFFREDKRKEPEELWLHVASSKGSYLVTASANDTSSPIFRRFIDSIRLNDNALYSPQKPYLSETQRLLVSSLKTDAVILEALRRPDSKQKKLERAAKGSGEEAVEKGVYSKPLIVLRKPRVGVDSVRGRVISGTVRVRITFLANGEIGNVDLLNSVEVSLDMNAFNAAKKIKFLPAEKNGKAVDVTKVIEFSFLVY